MKIGCLNIAKGLHTKSAVLEEILVKNSFDILSLLETDYPINVSAPRINGYHVPITHMNTSNYTRLVCYVKEETAFTKLDESSIHNFDDAPPHISIDLRTIRVTFIYNEHTKNAYATSGNTKLCPKTRLNRLRELLTDLNPTNKKHLVLGDMNIDILKKVPVVLRYAETLANIV